MGDAFIAYVSMDRGTSDEDVRDAVQQLLRASLAMLRWSANTNKTLSLKLEEMGCPVKRLAVRIGVAYGPSTFAIVGGERHFRYDCVDGCIGRAEELQGRAMYNGVLADVAVRERVGDALVFLPDNEDVQVEYGWKERGPYAEGLLGGAGQRPSVSSAPHGDTQSRGCNRVRVVKHVIEGLYARCQSVYTL